MPSTVALTSALSRTSIPTVLVSVPGTCRSPSTEPGAARTSLTRRRPRPRPRPLARYVWQQPPLVFRSQKPIKINPQPQNAGPLVHDFALPDSAGRGQPPQVWMLQRLVGTLDTGLNAAWNWPRHVTSGSSYLPLFSSTAPFYMYYSQLEHLLSGCRVQK
eukprot:gene1985-3003_t